MSSTLFHQINISKTVIKKCDNLVWLGKDQNKDNHDPSEWFFWDIPVYLIWKGQKNV